MGRLMCIDYGRKRCGVAVTDELKLVATGLVTVPTAGIFDFVRDYVASNSVEALILGRPRTLRGEDSESMRYITPFVNRLRRAMPQLQVEFFDERYTSVLAHRAMIDGGMKKKDRREKATVDRIAATIILNDYLQSQTFINR
ncbi:MAG: Holliday junction resolvase RuvX [Muribaculaceae bacterium]|nr:Holliday junction resolvase RuvX [Muribaculaceae bacterium]MDE6118796.1 Holliday junction resolvase RuvX [Muribaculaceae bacterium]MDE6315684.1 Holliday junction resolvase RuvX [Muribaculaceae bacterium]